MKIILIFLLARLFNIAQGIDQTLEEKTLGADVTDAVVRKITRTGIFSLDQGFFRRVAFAETAFGEDSKTYRDGYYGGIWQVDEEYYNMTKLLTQPAGIYEEIQRFFGINWQTTNWTDLLKPLHSGLAFKLYLEYLSNQGIRIEGTVDRQAHFWIINYRKSGPPATTEFFKDAIKRLESDGGPVCEGMMDICIILDGSGSVTNANFVKSKMFVVDLVKTISLNTSRVAFLTYGDAAYEIFDFRNSFTSQQMEQAIFNAPYPSENTNTPAALLMAIDFYTRINNTNGVPQIVVTFTDGQHNRGNLPEAVNAVKEAGLISFGIGITAAPKYYELLQIALSEPSRVFSVDDFDALTEFFYQLNSATCDIPQEPELGNNQTGSLNSGERRYFKYTIPVTGLHIFIQANANLSGWFSYSENNPNSAIYDGIIQVGVSFVIRFPNKIFQEGEANVVFITLQSNSEDSAAEYLIIADDKNLIVTEEPSLTEIPYTETPGVTTTGAATPVVTVQTEEPSLTEIPYTGTPGVTTEETTPEATTPEATTPEATTFTTTTKSSTTSEEPSTTESSANLYNMSFIQMFIPILLITYMF